MTSTSRPTAKYQAGGVGGAIWKNLTTLRNGQQIETLSVTLDRRYKDKSGEWKSASSFGLNDIPKAVLVLLKAYDFIVAANSSGSAGDDAPPNVPEEVVM